MNKLDDALKQHFSAKENVPQATKAALGKKLYAAAQTKEKLHWSWLVAPCIICAAVVLLALTHMLFGWVVTLLVAAVYYTTATMGAAVILAVVVRQAGVGKRLRTT
jgi:hypothetical protein